jgi:hypothetical protein
LEPWAQNALLYLSDDYFNKRQVSIARFPNPSTHCLPTQD